QKGSVSTDPRSQRMDKNVRKPRVVRKSPGRAQRTSVPQDVAVDDQIGEQNLGEPGGEATPDVGNALRRLRAARGMSLETLARASGVSRAMLSQIELSRSTPTIK